MKQVCAFVFLIAGLCGAAASENEHVELGTVHWMRDYDAALSLASSTGKPVLILFQEVPGCATCRNYGLQVLSHPLLAEAAGEFFVPLAVFNNRGGADAEVLTLFREPSWNNPVVRIIDGSGREIVRRLADDYSPGGFSGALIEALRASGARAPEYLRLVHAELTAAGSPETAVRSMFCFWQGEIELGGIDGVVATRAGFADGAEVVEVTYDSSRLSYAALLRQASRLQCADNVFALNDQQRAIAGRVLGSKRVRPSGGFPADAGNAGNARTKYYLARTPYRFVPMTGLQQIRANIAVYEGRDPAYLLSSRQRMMLRYIETHRDEVWVSRIASEVFRADWETVSALAGL